MRRPSPAEDCPEHHPPVKGSIRTSCIIRMAMLISFPADQAVICSLCQDMVLKTNLATAKCGHGFHRACDGLQADDRSKNKSVSITWQIEGTKNRAVMVDSVEVFLQKATDLTGSSLPPFQDISL